MSKPPCKDIGHTSSLGATTLLLQVPSTPEAIPMTRVPKAFPSVETLCHAFICPILIFPPSPASGTGSNSQIINLDVLLFNLLSNSLNSRCKTSLLYLPMPLISMCTMTSGLSKYSVPRPWYQEGSTSQLSCHGSEPTMVPQTVLVSSERTSLPQYPTQYTCLRGE